jgi:hypothetical protein
LASQPEEYLSSAAVAQTDSHLGFSWR